MTLQETMTINEIANSSAYLQQLSKWLLVARYPQDRNMPLHTVLTKGAVIPALEGLEAMCALDRQGICTLFDYYTEQDKRKSPDKRKTKLLYVPGKPGAPFAVVCPGGAYQDVWTISEGISSMVALSKQGYHAFSLVYRVDQQGLLPKPMDDLAAAIRYIRETNKSFAVNRDHYAVVGYSAGGHLAAAWGSDNHGWHCYGLPKPEAILLGYPALSPLDFHDNIISGIGGKTYADEARSYLTHFTKAEPKREELMEYSVECHVDAKYPKTYLIHSADDTHVNYQTAVLFDQCLQRMGIPHVLETVSHCGHGFAVGIGTEAEGWFTRAMRFWNV